MRGLYNGEIKDRPHVFHIFFYILLVVIITCPLFYAGIKQASHAPSNEWFHNDGKDHTIRGFILICISLFLFGFLLIATGREFIFLKINKTRISIRRPLLRFSPFKKDKTDIEIPINDVAEINTYIPPGRGSSRMWRIISKDEKEILKFPFNPEFITYTVELEDYFKENEINIKVNYQRPASK
jgi:hypothetical protein